MSELASLGKTVSIFISFIAYLYCWMWAIEHQKDCNKNDIWEVLVARLFIGLNIIAMVIWFIWSWNS